jgi:transcriptional regulator with XRE-family HTH domain
MTSEVMASGPAPPYRSSMLTAPPAAAPLPSGAGAGTLLRYWRTARHLSQLDLALETGVSARHLSCLETGRSQPSREMVLRLAEALEIPLRERNALLVAGGYAPRYYETGLAAPEMAQMRSAIELILNHQEPYPAIVMDRHWDVRMGNQAAARFTRFLLGADPTDSNIIRLSLHPNGLKPVTVNWEETAEDLIRHLHSQIAALPSDERAKELLEEVLGYPGVPARWRTREIGAPVTPLLTTIFRKDGIELRYFSTITTFATPHDVTLDELRIECAFPADQATAAASRKLFGS